MKTLDLLKSAKNEDLLPNFAKIRLSIRSGSMKLKLKIARLTMEVRLQSKHLERRKLKREMIKICHQMKEDIGLILFHTVNYYLNKVIAKTLIKVKHRHEKKFVNLRPHKRKLYGESNTLFIRRLYIIIHRTICQ